VNLSFLLFLPARKGLRKLFGTSNEPAASSN
jgi:hypothetical protein